MKAYRVSADSDSYCWFITAYLALGRTFDATRLLAEMGDRGVRREGGREGGGEGGINEGNRREIF
jgi:hypothetical protein